MIELPLIGPYDMTGAACPPGHGAPPAARVAFAAAHVVADPLSDTAPGAPALLDWDATLAFRRHLWSCGLAVAEAMDTAQRGSGLSWPAARELIVRSAAEARADGGRIAVGIGTDHLEEARVVGDVTAAYLAQLAVAEEAGAQAIVMASRSLAALARGPEDYAGVYAAVLAQTSRPVILHWLGPMFDPALAGYWGTPDPDEAVAVLVGICREHPVDGVKISMLDDGLERRLRAALPDGVVVYTGDDLHYPELIADGSHALLGVFDAIAPVAGPALRLLDSGDTEGCLARLSPTLPLARHLFAAPTRFYKTGLVFLAWLCGHQRAFSMIGGQVGGRGVPHLAEVFRLADQAGLFPDPDLAEARMRHYLTVAS
jgi:dihydrodipicolinate synthase/N-acetylneuraminate lyase